jgi:hypothetical protein
MVGAASSGIVVVRCGSGEGDDGNRVESRKMLNINQQGHVCRSLNELAPTLPVLDVHNHHSLRLGSTVSSVFNY